MKKLTLFLCLFAIASCSKTEQFSTTVKTLPKNIAFSLNANLPYRVTVQAESMDKNGQFVFSANEKSIFDTFKAAVKDTSDVKITVELGEIVEAEKVKK